MDRIIRNLIFTLALAAVAISARAALAADIPSAVIQAPIGFVRLGETVPVTISVDSHGQAINSADIHLRFSTNTLKVERINREQSTLTLWPEEPHWDNALGTIGFVGGRPGGFLAAPAQFVTIYFRATASGLAQVVTDDSKSAVYKNDGQGTRLGLDGAKFEFLVTDSLVTGIPLVSSTHPRPDAWYQQQMVDIVWATNPGDSFSYTFAGNNGTVPDDIPEVVIGHMTYPDLADGVYTFSIKQLASDGVWSPITTRRFAIDHTPPEAFTISHPQPADVGGQEIIAFTADDLASGVVRYTATVGGQSIGVVKSPLVLKHAWRGKTLTITAIDQAGNQQSSTWQYPGASGWPILTWVVIVLGVLLLAAVIVTIIVRRRR